MGQPGKGVRKSCYAFLRIAFSVFLVFSAKSPLSLVAAAVIHEAGHILCGVIIGGQLPSLEITPGGMRLRYTALPTRWARVAVSLAGPVLSLALAMLNREHHMFSMYSLSLGTVNLLPISALDGGNALWAVCEGFTKQYVCYRVCKYISVITTLLLFGFNCAIQLKYGTNLSLAVVSVFLTVSILGKE